MIQRECGVLKTSYEADMALYPLPIARWTVAVLAVIFFLLIPLTLHEYYLSVANLVWIAVIGAIGLNILLPNEKGGNEFQDVGFDFRYFFARKMMFVRFASAYVVLPGGFGTIDELTECLTLVQTGKSRKIPIILVGGEFWKGLVAWMQDKLVGEGMISANDLDLLRIIEEPEAIVEAIFDYYESRGFQPTRAERDKMLNL